jgi:RNA chaperone Hfq
LDLWQFQLYFSQHQWHALPGLGGERQCQWHRIGGQGCIMSVINVQESFLNVALAGGKHITVQLLNGAQVSGNVRSFDKYSIVLETKTQEQLIFKHSVSALLVCCKNKQCTETCEPGSGVRKPD